MKRHLLPVALACALAALFGARPLAAAVCTQPGQFGPATRLHTGPNPLFTVVADFNNDGKMDLAVTNSDFKSVTPAGYVAVLLGTGPFTFAPPVTYPVGSVPHQLVAADFNGDGILDLAVANKFSSDISILIGHGGGGLGDGTFAPAVSYPAGGFPIQLAVGDFNGDGALDLATGLNDRHDMAVLLGNVDAGHGDGTFAAPVLYPDLDLSTGIAKGDFNGDGITDLVCTENYNHTIAVYLGHGAGGHGDGTFAPAVHLAAGIEPFDIAVDDFNGDGKADLAVANTTSGGTGIMLGHGDGTFSAPAFLPSGNTGVVTTLDANGDGIRDLAVGFGDGFDNGGTLVYLGNGSGGHGDGTFGPATQYVFGTDSYQINPADLDGDGKPDLVVNAYNDDFVDILQGACLATPPDLRRPVITHVKDVPADQGGKVFLTWTASSLDTPGGPVNEYRVWRQIPSWLALRKGVGASTTSAVRAAPHAAPNSTAVTYWEELTTMPAQRLAGYGYTAATLADSSADGNAYTTFFVTAATGNIDLFFDSNVDSGYSVDNLPPGPPSGFAATVVAGPATALHWLPNGEADLANYRLYRGTSGNFDAGAATLVATPTDTTYTDAVQGSYWYRLMAVDRHGNESASVEVSPPATTGVEPGVGAEFALYGTRPNPGSGDAVTIVFSLPVAGPARVSVLDVAGRAVLDRTLSAAPAGPQSVSFPGAPRLRGGIYFVRLVQGERSAVVKAVIR